MEDIELRMKLPRENVQNENRQGIVMKSSTMQGSGREWEAKEN